MVAQICQQQLDREPRASKNYRLHAVVHQPCGDGLGFEQARASQAEGGVDQRRVVEDEVALALGGTVFVHESHR